MTNLASFRHSGDIKENEKRKNVICGDCVTQGLRQSHHSLQRIHEFLFALHGNYASIVYRFRDSELFVESRKFFVPHV